MKVLFFILAVLIAPIVASADDISVAKKIDSKPGVSAKQTEMGYKSSERIALKKQLLQIESQNKF